MSFILQGQVNAVGNTSTVDIYTSVGGVLTNPYEMSFQIFDVTTDAKRNEFYNGDRNLVQVYPETAGERAFVNVNNLISDNPPGNKISEGHFYAPWTCSPQANVGEHIIVWYFKRLANTTERTFTEEFYVAESSAGSGGCVITENDIRRYMRDKVPKNILLDDLDYSTEEITKGIGMVVDKFNIMPVFTQYTCKNFPSKYLLLIGTAAHLLEHNAWEQLRNQLSYNDGNIHMGIHDKHQLYLAAARTLWQEWEKAARDLKNAINLNGAWGDLGSPYVGVNYY